MNYRELVALMRGASPVQEAGGPQGEVKPKPIINWELRLKNALDYGGDDDLQKVLRDAAKAGITFGPQFDGMMK